MPVNQYSLSIPQSVVVWTSVQYTNADVSHFAVATQKGKADDKSLGTKYRVLKIFVFERFSKSAQVATIKKSLHILYLDLMICMGQNL